MSRDKSPPGLSPEDLAIWRELGDSVKPLARPAAAVTAGPAKKAPEPDAKPRPLEAPKPARAAVPFAEPYVPPVSRRGLGARTQAIDDKTARKLNRGRLAIDARIDLHGRTEAEAYRSLLRFIERSAKLDHKLVLVITGKGERSGAVLRQAAPKWLSAPPLAQFVGGVRQAGAPHGAEGALYVRLRSRKPWVETKK